MHDFTFLKQERAKLKNDKEQQKNQAKIWKNICRKEVPKAQKALQARVAELQTKARKCSDMCSKAIKKQV